MLKIFFILSYLIPKRKHVHLFLPLHESNKFSDNIKALILYSNRNHPEVKSLLFATNKKVIREAKEYGVQVIENRFLKLWCILRAEIIFIDAHTNLFQYGKFSFVQLWHGVGFKCVGLLWEKEGISAEKRKEVYTQIYKKCKLVAATSQSNADTQNTAFATNTATITGYPRNDIFFRGKNFEYQLRRKYEVDKYDRIITYAPTFRDVKTIRPFSNQFWKKLNNYLISSNELFIVKKHPKDLFIEIPETFSNIKNFTHIVSDTQELLVITDLLITDYSSISTDFSITQRPIIIYAYDIDSYMKNCREMYYDLDKILPKPFIKTEDDLLKVLQDNGWWNHPEVKESYSKFRKTFHHYLDGNSSQRVMQKTLEL